MTEPGADTSAAAALTALLGHEAWAVIRLRDSATVTLVGGSRSERSRATRPGPAPASRAHRAQARSSRPDAPSG